MIEQHINSYIDRLKKALDNLDRKEIEQFENILTIARDSGSNIFIMGNGGSAATASHYCCDFNKVASYGYDDRKRFRFICLSDNISTVMSYSNDVCYEDIFVEQLKNFVQKNDVVIGISSSGNSENVLRAIDYANQNGIVTVGLTGCDGGKLKQKAKFSVNANIGDKQIAEDIHLILCHMLMQISCAQK